MWLEIWHNDTIYVFPNVHPDSCENHRHKLSNSFPSSTYYTLVKRIWDFVFAIHPKLMKCLSNASMFNHLNLAKLKLNAHSHLLKSNNCFIHWTLNQLQLHRTLSLEVLKREYSGELGLWYGYWCSRSSRGHNISCHDNDSKYERSFFSWRRHQMETFSVLLAHCEGEPIGHWWIPLTKSSDTQLWCFFDLRLNKRLGKQSRRRWFESPPRTFTKISETGVSLTKCQ